MIKIIEKVFSLFNSHRLLDQESLEQHKTLCMLPWVHLHITQYGTVTPCCQAPWQAEHAFGDINEQSVEEIWQGDKMNQFRANMIKGVPDKRCQRCYEKENSGVVSLRELSNGHYKHKVDWVNETDKKGRVKNAKPIYWDFRASNVCNFKCRICGPWSSSRWYKDAVELGWTAENDSKGLTYAVTDFTSLLDQMEKYVDELEEIYFAGGEPLVMEEHYQILDFLEKRNKYNVRLTYNTNFSILKYKDRDVLDTWSKFETVWVRASIDDSYERGELQRKNMDWNTVLENRHEQLKRCPEVDFMISPTLSLFNVFHLPEFHREWVEKGLIDVMVFWPTFLIQPEEFNIRVLPEKMKKEVIKLYEDHIQWIRSQPTADEYRRGRLVQQYKSILDHLKSEDHSHLIPAFIEKNRQIDKVRGENVFETIPELAPLLAFDK